MSDSNVETLLHPSVAALVVANVIPLVGVLFFGWTALDIAVLFWFENIIVAFYNLIRMFKLIGVAAIGDAFFFLIYFGALSMLHILLVLGIFAAFADKVVPVSQVAFWQAVQNIWPALVGLLASHGISYLSNFIGRKEYKHTTMAQLLKQPYGRTLIPQASLLVALFFVLASSAPVAALACLIIFKIFIDMHFHKQVHGLS